MNSEKKKLYTGVGVKARLSFSQPNQTKDIDMAEDTRKGVQSVDKAFGLLRIFEDSPTPLSVNSLALRSKMTPSQVHHYLVSLLRAGMVRQTVDSTYELGTYAIQLGLTALNRIEPVEQATIAAKQLRDHTGEAVFISLWGSHGPTIIRYFEGFQPITVEVRTGNVLPVDRSASGLVFLAWGGDVVNRHLTDPDEDVKQQILRTRETGLGIVDGSLLPRVAAIAAPVFDYDNRLAFVLTVLGWSGELDIRADGALANATRQTAHNLSAALGHQTLMPSGTPARE